MALDFLILYEHTVREYESDLLLKLELERRGYTVRIRQLLDAKDLRLFGKDKPEVLVASCMYDNEAINSHVYNNIGKCNKIVNLHWEQMLSDTQEEGDWFNMNGNAKRCVQTCWGQRTAQRLQAHGMDAKNTPVTGAVMMDFLRPEFKGYFKDKETLCKEFGLDPAKQLHLYISSFGYASMTDQEVAELSKMVWPVRSPKVRRGRPAGTGAGAGPRPVHARDLYQSGPRTHGLPLPAQLLHGHQERTLLPALLPGL